MKWLDKLSVRHKLTAIIMITVAGAVTLLAGVLVFKQAGEQRDSLYQKRAEQLAAAAQIIGSRSTAALVFNDAATAVENLNSLAALRADRALLLAGIFLPDGSTFAAYRPGPEPPASRSLPAPEGCVTGRAGGQSLLQVCAPIELDGERLGEVRIVYDMADDLRQFRNSLKTFVGSVLVVVAAAFGFALLLSLWLQRIITRPILTLRAAMRTVSEQKDYSVRAPRAGDDELGALVEGFNDMLAQIQERDTALARHRGRLQKAVKTRTLELRQANRQRLWWLENLARILRHELKSTTVGVRSSLDLIERRAADPRLEKYVERAKTSVNYMTKLLDSVGAASTLESSFGQDPKRRLDLAQLAERQTEHYRSLYPGVEFVCHRRTAAPVLVLASDERLVQLLDKLIANAVDHHSLGSVIDIAVDAVDNDAGTAVLSVSNQGAPLPDNRERIFELFVSLRNPEHKHNENFGLGLYIVKLIVESHGGQVSAEDLPGRSGARFKVSLPLARHEPLEHQAASQR